MSRPTLRRSGAAALLALALGSLTACGGDTDDDAGGGPSSDGSTSGSTSTAGGSGTGGSDAPVTEGGEEIEPDEFIDVYRTALDQATTTHVTMTTEGGPTEVEIEGDGDFTTDPPSFELTVEDPAGGGPQTTILVDGALYLQAPGSEGTYFKTDLASSGLGSSTDLLDPAALVDQLAGAITTATRYGEEDVDGEELEHYGIEVDSRALLASSGAGDELGELPSGTMPDTVAYDTYFDADDNLRRIRIDLGGQAGSVDVRYDAWGEPVDIEAPPAADVQEFPTGSPTR